MDLTLTDEQELIASTARELLEARSPTASVRAVEDDPAGYSHELWKEMVELGWTGLTLPEEHGGSGATFLDLCLVVEQMGRCQVPNPLVPSLVLCGMSIDRFASDHQRAAWLPALAGGDKVLTYVRGAPRGGWASDDSDVVATEEGERYRLDGVALFVPFAHVADAFLVVARREGAAADQLTVFLVEAGTSGIDAVPLGTVGGDRQHRVTFEGVAAPTANVVGDVDDGRSLVQHVTELGAVATCIEMVGGAQRVLDMTIEYASERQQFGRSVGSFQAVQHHCANMAMDVLGSRFIAYEAAWRCSEGLDAAEEVSIAKGWVSDAYHRVCALGHQVHGAIGFTREHDMHYFFRHAMASGVAFGDSDFHWGRVAEHLGLP